MKKHTALFLCLLASAALTACTGTESTLARQPETTAASSDTTVSAADTAAAPAETTNADTAAPAETTAASAAAQEISVTDLAGTWYRNGDLREARMTIDYDGRFTEVYEDRTPGQPDSVSVTSGTVRTETENGQTLCCFYDIEGSLIYRCSAGTPLPVTDLKDELTAGSTVFRSEAAIVADAAQMKQYYPYLAGTYTRDIFGAETISIESDGSFTHDTGTASLSGTVEFISARNDDGTCALQCQLTISGGGADLIFPVTDIRDPWKSLRDMDFDKQ
ncbi:MAG: hypothetical protein IKS42_08345 [Oscillospiraceae bacterium]|nr:hypothetical protein [Oscillospiraceae bacterium]